MSGCLNIGRLEFEKLTDAKNQDHPINRLKISQSVRFEPRVI